MTQPVLATTVTGGILAGQYIDVCMHEYRKTGDDAINVNLIADSTTDIEVDAVKVTDKKNDWFKVWIPTTAGQKG